jgi:alanine racemase
MLVMSPAASDTGNHVEIEGVLVEGAVVVNRATVVSGSIPKDTVVKKNCSLHVRGSLIGSLTIEEGANVLIDGSIEGKIVNRGGRLVVQHKGLTESVVMDGPSADEADAVMKINLSALAFNFATLARNTGADCAAVLECNAYGCGVDLVADALAKSDCRTFFVTNLAEARRVRDVAPKSVIYVLRGLHAGAAHLFAKLNAQPVINSAIELAEWDAFVIANRWSGGCALNVDIGENRLGLSTAETVHLSTRVRFLDHGITLLMGNLAGAKDREVERQIDHFSELRRLYRGVPASLAGGSAIFRHRKCHFDLVRADSVLFGINPVSGSPNPMLPVIELRARIVHVRDMTPGQDFIHAGAKRRRLAMVSVGQADGFPRYWHPNTKLHAVVAGYRCPVVAPSSLDLLGIDVTDLPDPKAAWSGEMATLIGSTVTIDEVAKATRSTGGEVLSALGNRFHRIYYAT